MNNAFYIINKPAWITSFKALWGLKKILSEKRIGHNWTLDPFATGVLFVAVWNYTKLLQYVENVDKEYETQIMLDWISASYDIDTPVEYLSLEKQQYFKENITLEQIKDIIEKKFTWKIKQIPPKYSAIKINWEKALFKVKAWVEFEMKTRDVEIKKIEILSFNYPSLVLRLSVSAWTYIRSIAWDLGQILWTWWYLKTLTRTRVWNFWIEKAQNLEDFCINEKLDEKLIFWDNFIGLGENDIINLDLWKKITTNLQYDNWKILFVYDWKKITNIVEKEDFFLIPKRKI